MSAHVPGWYLDPQHQGKHRYWDGTSWDTATAEEQYGDTE